MKCEACNNLIPEERLAALPGTRRCVACSDTRRVKGRVVYDHKTAGAVEVLSPETFDAAQCADPRSQRWSGREDLSDSSRLRQKDKANRGYQGYSNDLE